VTIISCSRFHSRLGIVTAVALLVAACENDGDSERDAGVRDATVTKDAARGGQGDAANGGEDADVDDLTWRCNLNDYGCYCSERYRPERQQACDTSGCCILVQRSDGDTCACLSAAGAKLRQQTCEAWLDEQVATCQDAACTTVESCPPGTAPVTAPDAGKDAGREDGGTTDDASPDAGGGNNMVPPIPNQGAFQHCVYPEGCFEFRDHRPSCYEGNEINCVSAFSGRYALGKCPTSNYGQTIVDQTSCGETALYVN